MDQFKSYDDYLSAQLVRSKSKWGRKPHFNWLFKQDLHDRWAIVKRSMGNPEMICCMGIRDGTEVREFEGYYPKAKVYGVDINENIKSIKGDKSLFFQYDFNKLPEDWESMFDLVYSNSIDHSYNPQETLREWARVLKPGGYLFIEFIIGGETRIEHNFTEEIVKQLVSDFEVVKNFNETKKVVVVAKNNK